MAHRLGMNPDWVHRPAQRRLRGIRAQDEGGPATDRLGRGRDRADRASRRTRPGRSSTRPTVRGKAQASVPGDGAAVGLVTLSDESPILDVECRTYGEYAGDMTLAVGPAAQVVAARDRARAASASPRARSPRCWRGATGRCPRSPTRCATESACKPKDIDLLVTNQPNRVFLRNWRDALELPKERHRRHLRRVRQPVRRRHPGQPGPRHLRRQLKKGDVVMMAAFAHAGDFAGAAAVRWGGRG